MLESARSQLKRERESHEEKCRDLLSQLERLAGEKREGDREIGGLRASLRGLGGTGSHSYLYMWAVANSSVIAFANGSSFTYLCLL